MTRVVHVMSPYKTVHADGRGEVGGVLSDLVGGRG